MPAGGGRDPAVVQFAEQDLQPLLPGQGGAGLPGRQLGQLVAVGPVHALQVGPGPGCGLAGGLPRGQVVVRAGHAGQGPVQGGGEDVGGQQGADGAHGGHRGHLRQVHVHAEDVDGQDRVDREAAAGHAADGDPDPGVGVAQVGGEGGGALVEGGLQVGQGGQGLVDGVGGQPAGADGGRLGGQQVLHLLRGEPGGGGRGGRCRPRLRRPRRRPAWCPPTRAGRGGRGGAAAAGWCGWARPMCGTPRRGGPAGPTPAAAARPGRGRRRGRSAAMAATSGSVRASRACRRGAGGMRWNGSGSACPGVRPCSSPGGRAVVMAVNPSSVAVRVEPRARRVSRRNVSTSPGRPRASRTRATSAVTSSGLMPGWAYLVREAFSFSAADSHATVQGGQLLLGDLAEVEGELVGGVPWPRSSRPSMRASTTVSESSGTGTETPVALRIAWCLRSRTSRTMPSIWLSRAVEGDRADDVAWLAEPVDAALALLVAGGVPGQVVVDDGLELLLQVHPLATGSRWRPARDRPPPAVSSAMRAIRSAGRQGAGDRGDARGLASARWPGARRRTRRCR